MSTRDVKTGADDSSERDAPNERLFDRIMYSLWKSTGFARLTREGVAAKIAAAKPLSIDPTNMDRILREEAEKLGCTIDSDGNVFAKGEEYDEAIDSRSRAGASHVSRYLLSQSGSEGSDAILPSSRRRESNPADYDDAIADAVVSDSRDDARCKDAKGLPWDRLRAEVQSWSPRRRTVFLLRFAHHWEIQDVAGAIGLSVQRAIALETLVRRKLITVLMREEMI